MAGAIQEYTANYQLEIPAFDFPGWNTFYTRTMRTVDSLLFQFSGMSNVKGAWKNSTVYALGDITVDTDLSTLWYCLVAHTSAASPTTFSADRTANPLNWQPTVPLATARGTWLPGSTFPVPTYRPNDFVVNGTQYAVCLVTHHPSNNFNNDVAAGKWTVLFDVSAVIPAFNSSAEGTIASAATTDIGSITATRINVTGVVGITSLGTATNAFKILRFSGILTLTHNATSLILPKGATFTTGAGDILHVTSDAAGNWRVIAGIKADGTPAFVAVGTTAGTVAAGNDTRITGALQAASNLSDVANAATARGNLGALAAASNLSDLGNVATARSNLGLVIGTNVEAFDPQLTSNIPQNSKSANYTTVLTDGEKHILHPSTDNNPRTFTIDSNANVAYPIGTAITFINRINVLTIAITTDTMILAGTATTGSRTLAVNGIATAIKTGTTEWLISGTGLT